MYFKWEDEKLVSIASWVDDLLICGNQQQVLKTKKEIFEHLKCDNEGELMEYVGCKIERTDDEIRLTQPVLLESLVDEFDIPDDQKNAATPGKGGDVLRKPDDDAMLVDSEMQTKYRSGVGKLMHMMRWSRPEISNAVRELSRFFSRAAPTHIKAMYRVMGYVVSTASKARILHPDRKCKEEDLHHFFFRIKGHADSDFGKDPETRRSVTGYTVFLEGVPTATKSRMQGCVTTSVTEAEYVSGADCAQEMLFTKQFLESLGLHVELPMELEIAL